MVATFGMVITDDLNPRDHKEEYLKELTRDNTQLLLNKLWEVHVLISVLHNVYNIGFLCSCL